MNASNIIDLFFLKEAGTSGPLLSNGHELHYGNYIIANWVRGKINVCEGSSHLPHQAKNIRLIVLNEKARHSNG